MKTQTIIASLALAVLSGCATEAQLMREAKVSRAEAEKLALAQAPNGRVEKFEIEKENGKIVWSFDIATPGSPNITEVQIDAVTGQVASVAQEGPAEQEKERQQDAREKKD